MQKIVSVGNFIKPFRVFSLTAESIDSFVLAKKQLESPQSFIFNQLSRFSEDPLELFSVKIDGSSVILMGYAGLIPLSIKESQETFEPGDYYVCVTSISDTHGTGNLVLFESCVNFKNAKKSLRKCRSTQLKSQKKINSLQKVKEHSVETEQVRQEQHVDTEPVDPNFKKRITEFKCELESKLEQYGNDIGQLLDSLN